MRRIFLSILSIAVVGCAVLKGSRDTDTRVDPEEAIPEEAIDDTPVGHIKGAPAEVPGLRPHDPTTLSEEDYAEVAERLGVEIAAIKAVVEVEAGPAHKGFWTEGKPIINFDLSMFRRFAARHNINLSKYQKSHAVIFSRPNTAKYGSQQAAQQARLDAAMTIDPLTAIEGTFWGMFQIGGFNWKQCGAKSAEDFVERMSRSEREQLEMFANFIEKTGMAKHLRNNDWAAFAKLYNGPGYAKHGYHTKLANSYTKHKRAASNSEK